MIGIYKITNTTNNKCYIGQSRDIEARWAKHLSAYKSSPDWELYRAFKKYGISAFKFEVIEECSIEELNEREIYWITQYDSFNNGYNMTLGGEACNGTNDKTVYQYDLSGQLIKEYKSAHDAARENNIQFTNICKVCRGERKTAGGFGWSYVKAESIEPIKTKRLGDGTVLQFTKEGEFVAEYSSAKEARRKTGINDTTIGLVCKGKGKTAGGFVWKYKNDV
jgi:group I intron endonuclease